MNALLLAWNTGVTPFGLAADECLASTRRAATQVLVPPGEIGTLEAGERTDAAIRDVDRLAETVYRIGFNPPHVRYFKGKRIAS